MTTTHKTTVIAEPGKLNIIIKREFDAPRDLVFNAMIDPKAIPHWWGILPNITSVEELDPRFGGRWHFSITMAGGSKHSFRGIFHVVSAPELIVQTTEFDGTPNRVFLETIQFENVGKGTTMTLTDVFQTLDDRNGALELGMFDAQDEVFDRLDSYLKKKINSLE